MNEQFREQSRLEDAKSRLDDLWDPNTPNQLPEVSRELKEWDEYFDRFRPFIQNREGQILDPNTNEPVSKNEYNNYYIDKREDLFKSNTTELPEDPYKYLGKVELIRELAYVYKKDESPEKQIAEHLIKSNLMDIAHRNSKDTLRQGKIEKPKTENANEAYLSYINIAKKLSKKDIKEDDSITEGQTITKTETTVVQEEQSEVENAFNHVTYKTKPEGSSRLVKSYNMHSSEAVNLAEIHDLNHERQVLIHSLDHGDIYIKGDVAYMLREKSVLAHINRKPDNDDFPDVQPNKPWLGIGNITKILISEKVCPSNELDIFNQVPFEDPFIIAELIVKDIEKPNDTLASDDYDDDSPDVSIKPQEASTPVTTSNNEDIEVIHDVTSEKPDEPKIKILDRIIDRINVRFANLTERAKKSKYYNLCLAIGVSSVAAAGIVHLGLNDFSGSNQPVSESISNLPHQSGGGNGLDVTSVRTSKNLQNKKVQTKKTN